MGVNSKPAPSVAGVHLSMMAPCGTYTKPSRDTGLAAVCASSVRAGTIESSSGSAIDTPIPLRNVRRGRCFREMNMLSPPGGPKAARYVSIVGGLQTARYEFPAARLRCLLTERRAADDARHDRREPVVLLRRVARHRAHDRHVVVLEPAAQPVGHELFGQRPHELVRAAHDSRSQGHRTIHVAAVGQLARGVDGASRFLRAPGADAVEILERKP